MKKILLITTLIFAMLFVCTACGDSSVDTDSDKGNKTNVTETTDQNKTSTDEEESSILKDILNDAKEEAKEQITDEVKDASTNAVEDTVEVLNPELKGFLDEYESFMNDYCDFMERYNTGQYDTSDITSVLNELNDWTARCNEYSTKLQSYDPAIMSPVDLAYYELVTKRVEDRTNSIS